MAASNLGTLTLDLIARTGGFIAGMDKAERRSEKWRREVEKNMKAAGQAIGAASAIATGAMAVWIKSSINQAAEIENLARVAGASTTEFQRFAVGAKTVGIENDKLSDILKDVNDKVGDFLVTGGGPLADFFEKVAPKVGVTAEQFKNLSGPEALGLYVDTLEKAGANEQELTFFMEAIASDATALIPLLKDSGREMGVLADEAQNLGLILSDETVKGAKQFNDDLALLGRVANGVGQQIAADLLPELTSLTKELRNPETIKAASDMAKAVVGSFTSIITGARNTVQFIQWAAESAAAFMGGIAADDIVRLNDEIERLERMKASGALDRLVFFGRDGLVSYYNDEELDAELAKLRSAVEVAAQAGGPIALPVEPKLHIPGPGLGLPTNEDNAADAAAVQAAKKAADAAARQVKAINDQISALERAAATWGKTSDEIEIYELRQKRATDSQLEYAQSLLDTVSGLEKQKEAQEAYKSLVADLRTDEERLTDQLRERLSIIEAIDKISSADRKKQTGRAIDAAFSQAPSFGGSDARIVGPAGEFMKLNDAEKELENWYQTQLDMLGKFREERADLTAEWDEQELELKQQHEDALANIEKNRQLVALSAAESTFGSLADMAKTFAGEQSALYKTLFISEKAAAIARSTIAIQEGIALASANPFPANLAAMATVAAATAGIVGNIAAIGMAHDGIDKIPATGSWYLEKGERVTTAETSAKLDSTLSRIQADMAGQRSGGRSSGGITVNQNINTEGRIDRRTSTQMFADSARQQRIAQARLGK